MARVTPRGFARRLALVAGGCCACDDESHDRTACYGAALATAGWLLWHVCSTGCNTRWHTVTRPSAPGDLV